MHGTVDLLIQNFHLYIQISPLDTTKTLCSRIRQNLPVLNPFGDKTSAGDKKFPAALLTRMSRRPKLERATSTALFASEEDRTSPCTTSTCI